MAMGAGRASQLLVHGQGCTGCSPLCPRPWACRLPLGLFSPEYIALTGETAPEMAKLQWAHSEGSLLCESCCSMPRKADMVALQVVKGGPPKTADDIFEQARKAGAQEGTLQVNFGSSHC